MLRILTLSSLAATGLLLSACATLGTPVGLQPGQQLYLAPEQRVRVW